MTRPRRGAPTPTTRPPADLEAALEALGVEIRRADEDEIHGLCPMHVKRTGKQDRNPSWSVNRTSGAHNCFSCSYRGGFLQLVMDLRFRNDAFRAARWIRSFGIDLEAAVEATPVWQTRHEAPAVPGADLELASRLIMFDDPPPEALAKRRITAEAAAYYGVRWDTRQEAWILPIRSPADDTLLGWQLKSADGRFFRNYPAGVAKGRTLFGWDVAPHGEPLVILESPLDVVRLHSAGFLGGVSTFGAEWSDAQMALIVERTDEVIAAFDNDDSGWKAASMLISGDKRAKRRAWTIPGLYVLNYAGIKAKDVGDMDDTQIRWALEHARHWAELVTAPVRASGRR